MNNKVLWIILTVLWVLFAMPSAFMAMMSPMMFDAPGSTESPLTVAASILVVALPLAWLIGAGIPWIFFKKPWGIWLFAIPLVDVAAIVIVFVLMEKYCNGSLTCK